MILPMSCETLSGASFPRLPYAVGYLITVKVESDGQ